VFAATLEAMLRLDSVT